MADADRHLHVLAGCAPVPLAGYLKGLGVLRLVAEQPDKDARGCWRDEAFHLHTRLSREELLAFFLNDYRPSPVVAPWNGRAGFLEGEEEENGESTRLGATVVRAIEQSSASRLEQLRTAIASVREIGAIETYNSQRSRLKEIDRLLKLKIADNLEAFKREKADIARQAKDIKKSILMGARSSATDEYIEFIDSCYIISEEERAAPIFGSGGNDGSRDFGVNFLDALTRVMDFQSGNPTPGSERALNSSIFAASEEVGPCDTLGHFHPGQGGYNGGLGFFACNPLNHWDIVLIVEGALMFAGAATRRHESVSESLASFPFTVSYLAAGSGAVAMETATTPRGEMWMPLWEKPADVIELSRLFSEGRLTVDGRNARNGLDAARAVATLGVSRGIASFQRFAFLQSDRKMPYLATPLGRWRVPAIASRDLISDLERGGWLSLIRRYAKDKNTPARARTLVRRLDDALFVLTEPDTGRSREYEARVQAALVALGAVTRYLATAPKARENLPPPPVLSSAWLSLADDGSPEFQVAAALASLGHPPAGRGDGASRPDPLLPMAAHLAPLDLTQPFRRGPAWYDEKRRRPGARDGRLEAVWGDGDLPRNLIAVLQRRLIDRTGREEGVDDPLCAALGAPLSAVAAFLAGAGAFDDARCARLLCGLAWVRPERRLPPVGERPVVPLAYAALKPLFMPADRLHREWAIGGRTVRLLPDDRALPIPPGLVARLAGGQVAEAVRTALRRSHASGLASPFLETLVDDRHGASLFAKRSVDPRRLAAALLIPLDSAGFARVVERAYPPPGAAADAAPETETDDHAA
ncbi:type I-G CRISPR-associated protein Cas8g1/Csx17 [Azospirillum sp. sgz301742]